MAKSTLTGWQLQQSTKPYATMSQSAAEESQYLDNFTWGNPEKTERLGSLVRACEACYDYATSLQNAIHFRAKTASTTNHHLGPITPTLLITAIGVVPNIEHTSLMELKEADNLVYIVGKTYPELGGSEYYKLKGHLGATVPKVKCGKAKRAFIAVPKPSAAGLIKVAMTYPKAA